MVFNFLEEGLNSRIVSKNALSVNSVSHFSEVDLVVVVFKLPINLFKNLILDGHYMIIHIEYSLRLGLFKVELGCRKLISNWSLTWRLRDL